jgi:hypothetical protein
MERAQRGIGERPEAEAKEYLARTQLRGPFSLGSRCDLHRLFGLAQKVFGVLSHPSPYGVSFMVAFRIQDCCLFTRSGRGMPNVPPRQHFGMYFNSFV